MAKKYLIILRIYINDFQQKAYLLKTVFLINLWVVKIIFKILAIATVFYYWYINKLKFYLVQFILYFLGFSDNFRIFFANKCIVAKQIFQPFDITSNQGT